MDNKLAEDAAEAKAAGLSYGKWMAIKPASDPQQKPIPKTVKKCQYCGKEFVDKYNRNRRYCDDDCRNKAWYKRQELRCDLAEKKCEYCGKLFKPTRKSNRFCSNNCSSMSYYHRSRENQHG